MSALRRGHESRPTETARADLSPRSRHVRLGGEEASPFWSIGPFIGACFWCIRPFVRCIRSSIHRRYVEACKWTGSKEDRAKHESTCVWGEESLLLFFFLSMYPIFTRLRARVGRVSIKCPTMTLPFIAARFPTPSPLPHLGRQSFVFLVFSSLSSFFFVSLLFFFFIPPAPASARARQLLFLFIYIFVCERTLVISGGEGTGRSARAATESRRGENRVVGGVEPATDGPQRRAAGGGAVLTEG